MQFVIFAPPYDYTRRAYDEIIDDGDIHYINYFVDSNNKIIRLLSHLCYSKYEKYLPLKKSFWNPFHFIEKSKRNDNQYIFLFYDGLATRYMTDGSNYITYLKRKYASAKFVWYTVNPMHGRETNLEKEKSIFDVLITFDSYDSDRYDIAYYPNFMSEINVETDNEIEASDVYFLGAAKDRLEILLQVYDYLSEAGLKCIFVITGVTKTNVIYRPGIIYCNGISYYENIKYIKKTKCILEIVNEGQNGSTLRTMESIIYNKKLITNNYSLRNQDYYIEDNMLFLSQIDNINDFLKKEVIINDSIRAKIRPRSFLNFVKKCCS